MLDVFTKNPGFQYIAEDIFKILDIQTLTNSRLVNHSWRTILNKPIFLLKKLKLESPALTFNLKKMSPLDFITQLAEKGKFTNMINYILGDVELHDGSMVKTGLLFYTYGAADDNYELQLCLKRWEKPCVSRQLTPNEEELINHLVYFQIEYEFPKELDLKNIWLYDKSPLDIGERDSLFRHITEMTILTVNCIVEFCKHLTGFSSLDKEDQIVILKECSSEIMMLKAARRYDPKTESIIFANGHPFTKENFNQAGLPLEELFLFCHKMNKMEVDNAEFGLLTAIAIFSERKNVNERKKMEKIQKEYVDTLQSYVMHRRKKDPIRRFAKLLTLLVELRSLGNLNIRTCRDLKLANRQLPDFLSEIWDIN